MTDRPTTFDLVRLCREAYTEEPTWRAGGAEVRYTVDPLIPDGGTHVWSFRGTTFDGLDILKDLRACPWRPRALGGLWVHKGFWRGVEALAGETGMPTYWRRLVLTGHSKGGAEATVMAALLCLNHFPPAAVVTFGSPRPGMAGLGKHLRKNGVRLERYVLGDDIVPLPQPPDRRLRGGGRRERRLTCGSS